MVNFTVEAGLNFDVEWEFNPATGAGTPVYVYLRREGGDILAIGCNDGSFTNDPAVIAGWFGVSVEGLPDHLVALLERHWEEVLEWRDCDSPY